MPHEFKRAEIAHAHRFALEIPNLGCCTRLLEIGVCAGCLCGWAHFPLCR